MRSRLPLTEAEFRKIDDFLMSDIVGENALMIDELHGFFTALAVTNQANVPLPFLSAVLDGEPRFRSDEEAWGIKDLLDRMYDQVVQMLSDEEFLFVPLFSFNTMNEELDPVPVPEGWCLGFLRGVAMQEDLWEKKADELWGFLLPVYVLSGMEDLPPDLEKTLYENLNMEELVDLMDFCVRSMHQCWVESGPESIIVH